MKDFWDGRIITSLLKDDPVPRYNSLALGVESQ